MLKKIKLIIDILISYSNGYLFFFEKLNLIKDQYIIFKTRKGMKYKTRRDSTDFAILNETVILKEYLQHGFSNLNKESIVLDFGAQAGDFSVYVGYTYGAKVYSYEPEPENFALFKENIKLNHLEDIVIPTQAAIDNQDSLMKLRLSGWKNKGTHSFHYIEGGDYVEVPTINILNLSEKFNMIDLLKIDIEGGEHVILDKRNKKFFDKVKRIVMEYHTQSYVTNSKGLKNLINILENDLDFKVIAKNGDKDLGNLYLVRN